MAKSLWEVHDPEVSNEAIDKLRFSREGKMSKRSVRLLVVGIAVLFAIIAFGKIGQANACNGIGEAGYDEQGNHTGCKDGKAVKTWGPVSTWKPDPGKKPTKTPTAPPPTPNPDPNPEPEPTIEATETESAPAPEFPNCDWYAEFDAAGHTCAQPIVPATAAPETEEVEQLTCNLRPGVFTDRLTTNGRTIVRREVDKEFKIASPEAINIFSALGGDNSDPSGAPTGWLTFVHDGQIWTAGHNGENPRPIEHKGKTLIGSQPFVAKIACASIIVFADENGILNVTDRWGSFIRPLVEGRRPNISPDGRDVLFETPQGTIGAVSISGPKTLLRDFGINGQMPTWHPEGKGVVFIRAGNVMFFDFETGKETLLMPGAQIAPNPARAEEGLLVQGIPLAAFGLRLPIPDLFESNTLATKRKLNVSWAEIESNPDWAVPAGVYNRTPFVLHVIKLKRPNGS